MAKAKSCTRKKLRVAFIGAGGRALMAHYPSLRDIPEAELVAVAELDEQRLHKTCDLYGIKGRYSDLPPRCSSAKNPTRFTPSCRRTTFSTSAPPCIEHGCHLIIEKPPAVTTEQIRQLAALARRHNVLTGVAFQRRFAPVIRHGKTLCEKRGTVHTAHASFLQKLGRRCSLLSRSIGHAYLRWHSRRGYPALPMRRRSRIRCQRLAPPRRRSLECPLSPSPFQQRGHRTLAQQLHGRSADVQRRGPCSRHFLLRRPRRRRPAIRRQQDRAHRRVGPLPS